MVSAWTRRARDRARRVGLGAVGIVAVALAFGSQAVAAAQGQPDKPIIVRIPQDPPKSELSGLADVLLGSLGLTGVIVLAAVVLGALMAGVMFWVRSRESR
jgi:ABC-type phosphate transport system permease subunit